MTDKEFKEDLKQEEGIIVETSLDILREGAKKVLYEFNESIFDMDGEPRANEFELQSGDTVLFVENIQNIPNRIAAVYITRNFWYVNTMSETPTGGYPSGVDAMRASKSDERNLQILERFLIEKEGRDHVKDVEDWKPDLKSDAADVLNILNQAIRKWHH
ncbi:MAG: hypothetical protein ACW98U_12545 [Candidatus Thorarchaeota archaeon]